MNPNEDRVAVLVETIGSLTSYSPCSAAASSLVTAPLRSCEFPISREDLVLVEDALNDHARAVRTERGVERDALLNELGRALSAVDYRKRQLTGNTEELSFGAFKEELGVPA